MRLTVVSLLLAGGLVLTAPIAYYEQRGQAANPKEVDPLVEQVKRSIEKGVQYLRDQENGRGHWETDMHSAQYKGGATSLAMLSLLYSGVKPNDPVIERGLDYLRKLEPQQTYVVGLQTMVFAMVGDKKDAVRIQQNVDWLVKNRSMNGKNLIGWSYGGKMRGHGSDGSNTQYALLGLHEGRRAGAKIDRDVWEQVKNMYINCQSPDGGFSYNVAHGGRGGSTPTMSFAGLCGLYMANMELNEGRQIINKDGSAKNCGEYDENKPIAKALESVARTFRFELGQVYYHMYGIERAGRLSGLRFIGDHDWYREGCEYLVRAQNKDAGGWAQGRGQSQVVTSAFALMFLSKGRTPILISKMVHGPGDDWNNKHNDLRNLVEHASKEMYKNQPLAWQIFEPRRVRAENRNDLAAMVGDLLQSPITFISGHEKPQFSDIEKELLKEYIEQGGFILAEACCGRKEFDAGFRKLVKDLFPQYDLKPLPPEHPVWTSFAAVKPGEFKLEGIEMGCKTVLIYSPQPMAGYWEANLHKDGRGELAFRMAMNIIAYATGMELPKPRLTKTDVILANQGERVVPRGFLKVAQLRHEGDWKPAPKAMRNLMLHLRERARLDVSITTQPIFASDRDLVDHPFLYLHGRHAFSFSDSEIDNLRASLERGGILFSDACSGKKAFDESFRAFAAKLFPDHKLELIKITDPLYGKELNGEAIKTVRCRRESADGKGVEPEFRDYVPHLEGIKIDGRWVVIYSKYDIGCALEKHQSSDSMGHDYDSAVKLGSAVVYYALRR